MLTSSSRSLGEAEHLSLISGNAGEELPTVGISDVPRPYREMTPVSLSHRQQPGAECETRLGQVAS